ncbi:MAG: TIGR02680 family protein [Bacillota bacterium]|jgi:uncharacterized protein (TIGR02680 family)
MTDRLQLNRAGLLNFWYYDNEVFDFTDGKLLLRGSNGSGKSVTMQSLITVLLDGRKSPDRLDPFGSRARKMEDYLLGESGISKLDERTGYLWLEYKRENSDRYITTGIGLRARRHSTMDFWGFVITDNRRVEVDINLHRQEYSPEEGKEVTAPLTRLELTNRIEPGGRVVRGQREYMELVNRYVFGFESIEAYEDLIKLLIQLRSPKLSKDFKPTVIYEILNESIPPLSDDELRPLSETIENMDQIKQQLEQLERDRASLRKLTIAYDAYNRFMLAEKASGLVKAVANQDKLSRDMAQLETDLAQKQQQLEADCQLITRLDQEQKVLEQEKRELEQHDVFRAQEQLKETEDELAQAKESQTKKRQELEGKQRRERRLEAEVREQQSRIDQFQAQTESCLEEMEAIADAASFNAHGEYTKDFRRTQPYDFTLWKDEARDYSQQLNTILIAARKYSFALERHQDAEDEHAQITRELDQLIHNHKTLEEQQDSLKEQWLQDFHHWEVCTQELKLTPQEKQQTAHFLMDIFDLHKPQTVTQPVRQAHDRNGKAIADELAILAARIHGKDQEIAQTQEEIQEWREMQEPEPQRHPDTTETRAALQAAGIAHVPLYAAVEFRDHIPEEERERLEAAITQAGLLDALVVPREHLASVKGWDKVILPNPRVLEYTLADVLEPVPCQGVDAQTIDDVLRSILMNPDSLESGDITVDSRGNYRIALVSGQAPREEASRYIGREARRRFRLSKIAQLEMKLSQQQGEREELEARKQQLDQRREILDQELSALPEFTALEENWQQITEVEGTLRITRKAEAEKSAKVKDTYAAMQAARHQLQVLARELNLPESEEAYAEAIKEMSNYTSLLRDLEGYHQRITHCRELMANHSEELEEVQGDVDTLKGDLNVSHARIQQLQFSISKIKERMQELGAEEITARIQTVIQRLDEIPQEGKDAYQRTVNLSRDIEDGQAREKGLKDQLEFSQRILSCWQQYFSHELSFGFVLKDTASEITDLLALARKVVKEYSSALNTDRERISIRLNKAFFEEQQYLVEYRPEQSEQTLAGDLPTLDQDWAQYLLTPLAQARHRQIIMLDYDGQKKDVYIVLDKMEQDIQVQQHLLSEKDRELYEEIILHSVGEIIRRRINRAENWVEEINKLMEQRDTSSGLTFSLRWKPRTAEQEDELDTEELVALLRKDPNLLKEEDMLQITRHFRSKIDRAKAELADTEKGETFHSIVRELLDYRTWFKFMLLFRKGKEPKRELTNNMFFTFSGGEKAMAMYIPLFSAAYSRYQDARGDAPRIISLDEAFAGVDETNIRDMFDLMEKLGFDYIINSQSLWGDYDTANRLSICELVRPKNAPWVTVIRYLWDGHTRRLLSN